MATARDQEIENAARVVEYAELVATAYVEKGWTPSAWVHRLRYLADRCEAVQPAIATQLRQWANAVERRHCPTEPQVTVAVVGTPPAPPPPLNRSSVVIPTSLPNVRF